MAQAIIYTVHCVGCDVDIDSGSSESDLRSWWEDFLKSNESPCGALCINELGLDGEVLGSAPL